MLLRLFIIAALLLPIPAHAESSECLVHKRRIDSKMADAKLCKTDADCKLMSLGCLGCNIAMGPGFGKISGDIGTFQKNCDKSCPAVECPEAPPGLEAWCNKGKCESYQPVPIGQEKPKPEPKPTQPGEKVTPVPYDPNRQMPLPKTVQ